MLLPRSSPLRLVAAAGLVMLAACGGGGQSSSTATASPTSAESGTPAVAGTPIAAPTATADPNLLSAGNGTILRSYSPAALDGMNDGNLAKKTVTPLPPLRHTKCENNGGHAAPRCTP